MRGFQCYYLDSIAPKKPNSNNACWAGIQKHFGGPSNMGNLAKPTTIYINNFEFPLTKEYILLLLDIINQITPCILIENYIHYDLLLTYDQNLILLNYIRNLWHCPSHMNADTGNNIYTKEFFAVLARSIDVDPLSRLSEANKMACIAANYPGAPGHSNVNKGVNLKIKKTHELLIYMGKSTATFLIT